MSMLATTRSSDLPDDAPEDTADDLAGAPFPAASGKLTRLPTAPAAPEQRVLSVEFRSSDGRQWHAIGGGATVAAAITFARESCPDDATWNIVGWEDLYGDQKRTRPARRGGPPNFMGRDDQDRSRKAMNADVDTAGVIVAITDGEPIREEVTITHARSQRANG